MDSDADGAFGFIDPDDILRATFLMPAFDHGTTNEYLPPSRLARRRPDDDIDLDYRFYYVSMSVSLYSLRETLV